MLTPTFHNSYAEKRTMFKYIGTIQFGSIYTNSIIKFFEHIAWFNNEINTVESYFTYATYELKLVANYRKDIHAVI